MCAAGRVAAFTAVGSDLTPIMSTEGEGALLCDTRANTRTSTTAVRRVQRGGTAQRLCGVRTRHNVAR